MSDIIRRDPRTEWIARNRLHPLHGTVSVSDEVEVRGPSGLLRKNPHKVGFIGPNGIKRIDRLKGNAAASGKGRKGGAAAEVQLPLHQVENPDFYIVVVPDMVGGRLTGHDKDMIGQAHKLINGLQSSSDEKGAVLAVCFGESKEEGFDTAGVDRLLLLNGDEYQGYCPEQQLAALVQVENTYQPKHWLFPDSVNGGADLGSRLAARINERPAVQAWLVDNSTTLSRGAGGTTDITRGTPRLLMLAEECAEPIDETRHEALDIELEHIPTVIAQLQDQGQVAVDPNAIPLGEAEFILSAGNGIHNWDQFHATATALGATEGASRVAVDDGFMPRFRQVGATGTWVTARVYLAVGISGAIQHMQGIGQCDKIIAINTDAGCDMVKGAALSTIGDSEEILAELNKLAENFRQQQADGSDQDAA
ncbi:electron transfer flavoprotein subunit alpha [Amphritea balenae]|uniref:Electron transfer flavoprotein subunit alpha/FixB family protein n=1 Tax=Amphritea balenae TaxID=452629 RepID=A0A3P1SY87_9GAMM|nr:electron transfer flavoprotein subunit alpha/FixB family protein [Amphritea balenae]RRD01516.1 electron transfer flavoprotein subunit alpha/FixB family protein [Amphritea balenae]GGK56377.1 electron transfer flavoprotein subunit alpha [Amphritea balenae]